MLEEIAEDLWGAEHDLFLPGSICFRGRMTVIRLPDGRLVLHSPVPIDDALRARIDTLGEVAFIIAPNLFHHLHLPAAAEMYRSAKVLAPEGLSAKHPELTLADAAATHVDDALTPLRISGAPKVNEIAWFHAPSKTLIVGDLVFNIHQTRGLLTPLVLWMVGAHRRFAQSRSWRLFIKERDAARGSIETILGHDFDRLIMGHGEVVHDGARDELARAVGWLGAGPRLLKA